MVGDFLVGAKPVAFFVEFAEIYRLAKPDANLFTARPVSQYLFWQVVAEAGDKDGYDLRFGGVDHFADSGLSGKKIVGAACQVSFSFGMKADHALTAGGANLDEAAHRVFVEFPFSDFTILAKERWIHRHPAHDKIDEPANGIVVKEFSADRKIQLKRPLCTPEKYARHRVHVKERAVIGNEYQRFVGICILDILDAENVHQIVRREIYPKAADVPLAKRHQPFPAAEIHSVSQAKGHSLGRCEYGDLIGRRDQHPEFVSRSDSFDCFRFKISHDAIRRRNTSPPDGGR